MTNEELFSVLTELADNRGLCLGDLDEVELHQLNDLAWRLCQATAAEIVARAALRRDSGEDAPAAPFGWESPWVAQELPPDLDW